MGIMSDNFIDEYFIVAVVSQLDIIILKTVSEVKKDSAQRPLLIRIASISKTAKKTLTLKLKLTENQRP